VAYKSKSKYVIYTINGKKVKRKIKRGCLDMQLLISSTTVVTDTGKRLKWRS